MNTIKNKKIAIIGGGPGGLTLARLLQMNGTDLKVYERDSHKDARPKGATLDLHQESGLLAIREAGLMEEFMANYRPGADRLRVVDKTATIIFDDRGKTNEERARPEIDRGPLQQILLNSLQSDTVVWDKQFVSMAQQDGKWHIEFKDGTTVVVDLVIGADGANSRIRPYLTDIKPFYAGITVVEGAVYHSATNSPRMHELLNGGKIFAFGDNKSLIVSSKGDGSLVFYTGMWTDENWYRQCNIDFSIKTNVMEWFKQAYEGWDDVWLELFENATLPFVLRPQYCMPIDQHWEALPNLTVLGDAAHLMPPYAGEGVNMAMLDAVGLSECLLNESYPDTHAAIAAYESKMRERASATAQMTLYSTEILHSENAIPFLVEVVS